MTDAERLQDAISELPEELLTPVDALRRQKRSYWKPIAAVAACALLVVGLYHYPPAQKSSDNGAFLEDAAEKAPAEGFGDGFSGSSSYSEHSADAPYAYTLTAEITEITENYLVVTLANGDTANVFLKLAGKTEDFSPGAEITLCFTEEPNNLKELYPVDILTN